MGDGYITLMAGGDDEHANEHLMLDSLNGSPRISGVGYPIGEYDVTNKGYVDNNFFSKDENGDLLLNDCSLTFYSSYIENGIYTEIEGSEEKPRLEFWGGNGDEQVELGHLASPTTPTSAATKQYVDDSFGNINSILDDIIALQENLLIPDGDEVNY